MSKMYDTVKQWIANLPDDAIVGTTWDSKCCLVATCFGRSTFDIPNKPKDVDKLMGAFDNLDPDYVTKTAGEVRHLFV